MRGIAPMETGLVFWAEQQAGAVLRQLNAFGLCAGQIVVPPGFSCESLFEDWKDALSEWNVNATNAVCCYRGESYDNLESIYKTVGFTPEGLRSDRIARTKAIANFAHALGISALSCHVGCIPDNPHDALYGDLRDVARLLCDHCGSLGQAFVLETGQETADVLVSFIHNVNRPNLKVNFDPANMIMYRSGDPLAALGLLRSHIISVHCKDARSPVSGSTGRLGEECALGDGEVNFPRFLQQLQGMAYQGLLSIECEEPSLTKRNAHIKLGVSRLKQWKASLGF